VTVTQFAVADDIYTRVRLLADDVDNSASDEWLDRFEIRGTPAIIALNAFSNDNNTAEASQWALAATKPIYTLSLGCADNEHTEPCPAGGCFPNPFSNATHFIGAGIDESAAAWLGRG
jgi:hypothetical protein